MAFSIGNVEVNVYAVCWGGRTWNRHIIIEGIVWRGAGRDHAFQRAAEGREETPQSK